MGKKKRKQKGVNPESTGSSNPSQTRTTSQAQSSSMQVPSKPQVSSMSQDPSQSQDPSKLQTPPKPQVSSMSQGPSRKPQVSSMSQSPSQSQVSSMSQAPSMPQTILHGKPINQSRGPGLDQNQGEVQKVAWGRNKQQQQQQQQQQQSPKVIAPQMVTPPLETSEPLSSSQSRIPQSVPSSSLTSSTSVHSTIAMGHQSPSVASTSISSSKSLQSMSPSQLNKKSSQSVVHQSTLDMIPVRRNPNVCGTRGKSIVIEVNMMSYEFKKLVTDITQYDVNINPDKPKSLMRRAFEKFRQTYFPSRHPAYDGNKIAYSAQDLPFGRYINGIVEIEDNNRTRTFVIEMTKSANLDLSFLKKVKPGFIETLKSQAGIQALDVILRHGPLSCNVSIGRSIFWQPRERTHYLTGGMELWTGQFQSAILGWKPYLNVDVSHKAFPISQNVIDLIREFCSAGERNRNITSSDISANIEKINKFIKGLKVHYEIPRVLASKRTHIARGLIRESPRTCKFQRSDGVFCTVEDYFRDEKRYIIRYPDWPCLWIGSPEKKIYVPPELCMIVAGQVSKEKLNEAQTATMIRHAATNTIIRKEKIMAGFNSLRMNEHPTMVNEFNLLINPEFEKVPARVLPAPTLKYRDADNVEVRKGVWRAKKMLHPIKLDANQWGILNLHSKFISYNEVTRFIQELERASFTYGMHIVKPNLYKEILHMKDQEIIAFFEQAKINNIQLVLVIIPDFNDVYCKVKQVTELKVNVLTQCVKSGTVKNKCNGATVGNIILKINSKLNGTNHSISNNVRPIVLDDTTILIGADVTHPSPDAINIPSIAAVTASCDTYGFKYAIELRLQPPRQEMISDLAQIIKNLFLKFYEQTKTKPSKVIVYRDGVSDGQLVHVLQNELPAFYEAFKLLSPRGDYKPPITFLVVQKRHHIRFFPTSQSQSDDRNFNVQAGTIVDTHITHSSHIDFYLVSHASIQGTARPTKYKCVYNEIGMTEDQIEELTYYLCHMFARCTRSVSYPAPTYYAHLAAFRARALIQNVKIHLEELPQEQKKVEVLMKNKSPMFFV